MPPEKYVVYELKGSSLGDSYTLDSLLPMKHKDIARVYGGDTDAHQADIDLFIIPPKTPKEHRHDVTAPWPFPKSSIAP